MSSENCYKNMLETLLSTPWKWECGCVVGLCMDQCCRPASVREETKVCLCASITLAHESRHLKKNLSPSLFSLPPFFFFKGNTLNQHPGYKFAKCNTGPIVCEVDVGCIQIDSVPLLFSSSKLLPPPCTNANPTLKFWRTEKPKATFCHFFVIV